MTHFLPRRLQEAIIIVCKPEEILVGIKTGQPLQKIFSGETPVAWSSDSPLTFVNSNKRIQSYEEIICQKILSRPVKENLSLFERFVKTNHLVNFFVENRFGHKFSLTYDRERSNRKRALEVLVRGRERHPAVLKRSPAVLNNDKKKTEKMNEDRNKSPELQYDDSSDDGMISDVDDCLVTEQPQAMSTPNGQDKQNEMTKEENQEVEVIKVSKTEDKNKKQEKADNVPDKRNEGCAVHVSKNAEQQRNGQNNANTETGTIANQKKRKRDQVEQEDKTK